MEVDNSCGGYGGGSGGREKMCGGVEVGHKEKTMNKEKKKGRMNSAFKKRKERKIKG